MTNYKYVPQGPVEVPGIGTCLVRQLTKREVEGIALSASKKDASNAEQVAIDAQIVRDCVLEWPEGPPEDVRDIADSAFKFLCRHVLIESGVVKRDEPEDPKDGPANLETTPTD